MTGIEGPMILPVGWPPLAGVRACTTGRRGGVSRGVFGSFNLGDHVGDAPAHVSANRAALRARLTLSSEPWWLQQVHGSRVVQAGVGPQCPQADASWTTQSGMPCAILTADCLPVLFRGLDGSCVAAAHAGWRGLAAGVLENTLAALPLHAGGVEAWCGPCIGPAAFEVGPEVRQCFLDADPGSVSCFVPSPAGRWLADLPALARRRLLAAGVHKVHLDRGCTFAEGQRFFSYRRDGQTGRMATMIWLE